MNNHRSAQYTPLRSDSCGYGTFFRPKWIQKFANYKSFMVIYGLLGTVQAMSYVYFIATMTTIERRFSIPSKTTGIMLSGNEVSQILLALILSYAGGQRNRPVWIAWGVAFSALSCVIMASPHFIYGPGEKALSYTKEYLDSVVVNQTVEDLKDSMGLCSETKSLKECDAEYSLIPPTLIFISQFILGIGTSLYYSLGQTYIDDNTKKTNTPMVLGLTMALRTIGPSFGFVIAFFCMKVYIDPSLTPIISYKDKNWLGAWWLGWLVFAGIMLIFSFLIALFPQKLPNGQKSIDKGTELKETKSPYIEQTDSEKKPPTIKEFPEALKRLLKNKLLIINILAAVFYILGGSGYITYLTKYMEVQFDRSSASANIVLGPAALFSMVFSFIISGYIISRFKPRPIYLLGWNVIVGFVFVFGELLFVFISCNDTNLVGYNVEARSVEVNNTCNDGCGCDNLKYSPVCLIEQGLTFYSPCHAGCRTVNHNDTSKHYSNCSCIPHESVSFHGLQDVSNANYYTYSGIMKEGPCPTECGYNFIIFIAVSCLMHSLGSSGKIGNILVNYRAVKPEEKAFAQGLSLLLISLLAFIPGPIIFGSIIDSTCLIWDSNCGEKGNCWFYDKHAFRKNLNLTAAVFTTIGATLDAIVCYLGKDLKLYEEQEGNNEIKNKNCS